MESPCRSDYNRISRKFFEVNSHDFSDSALIVVGHGSTLNSESSAPTYKHCDEIRRRRIFLQVLESFWKLEPSICGVTRGVSAGRAFVVPLFISDGYFTQQVIPRELGLCPAGAPEFSRTAIVDGRRITYCEPVGTHSSMTRVILSMANEVVQKHPFPRAPKPSESTLFIAGHGTGNNENSRKSIEIQVELIRAMNRYSNVFPLFMEEEPRIERCYEMALTRHLVIVPFFISDGLHSYEDIPMMLGEPEKNVRERLRLGQPTWPNPSEKRGKLVWYSASIGDEPLIADVILNRVREVCSSEEPTC